MSSPHLLIVDDEDNLRSMLCAALRHHGFEITAAPGGNEALAELDHSQPDLVVLDVMMPDVDGFEVCRRLRAAGDETPVLFLTARGSTEDKVHGLKIGGDDYLEKPFSIDELVARAEAILRRVKNVDGEPMTLQLADLTVDDAAHLVARAGEHIHLSPTEYKLLHFMLVNQGIVVSKDTILDRVWGYNFDGEYGIVETYIGYLRKKVDFANPKLIHTVRGAGYTMRIDP